MTDCAHCGEYLHIDEEWRLRPEITPGSLETKDDYDPDETYMHPECWEEYQSEVA